MDQIAIGARIKAARERVHLTQEQLAEIIDISYGRCADPGKFA